MSVTPPNLINELISSILLFLNFPQLSPRKASVGASISGVVGINAVFAISIPQGYLRERLG